MDQPNLLTRARRFGRKHVALILMIAILLALLVCLGIAYQVSTLNSALLNNQTNSSTSTTTSSREMISSSSSEESSSSSSETSSSSSSESSSSSSSVEPDGFNVTSIFKTGATKLDHDYTFDNATYNLDQPLPITYSPALLGNTTDPTLSSADYNKLSTAMGSTISIPIIDCRNDNTNLGSMASWTTKSFTMSNGIWTVPVPTTWRAFRQTQAGAESLFLEGCYKGEALGIDFNGSLAGNPVTVSDLNMPKDTLTAKGKKGDKSLTAKFTRETVAQLLYRTYGTYGNGNYPTTYRGYTILQDNGKYLISQIHFVNIFTTVQYPEREHILTEMSQQWLIQYARSTGYL